MAAPENPNAADWNYAEFDERRLKASTIRQVADYQARLAGWFTQGGFSDESGVWHESGHHYDIAYWEVLNEPDFEGNLSPQVCSQLYDAIVIAVKKVAPRLKFMGPAVGDAAGAAKYFAYFLDPQHHRAGVPIDMISYHLFAIPDADESIETQQYTFFRQADASLISASYIDALRRRFAPDARTDVDNVATMLPRSAEAHVEGTDSQELLESIRRRVRLSVRTTGGARNGRGRRVRTHRLSGHGGGLHAHELGDWHPECTLLGAPAFARPIQMVDQSTAALPTRRPLSTDSIVLGGFAVAVVTLPR